MAERTQPQPPYADAARLMGELGKQWEQAMGAWWDQVLESPDVLRAVGQSVSATSRQRGAYQQAVDASLEQLHLPTRADLLRMTRIAVQLEQRLLQLEDRLLDLGDGLADARAKAEASEREALQARISAAEAQLAHQAQLTALSARLSALAAALERRPLVDAPAPGPVGDGAPADGVSG